MNTPDPQLDPASTRELNPSTGHESDLLARLRTGDEPAYAEFVRTNVGRMLAVARRFLRSEQDADDAVQEAFVSLVRSIEKFQGQSSLSTWTHRIVVNVCLMKLRSRKNRATTSIEELLPQFEADGHRTRPGQDWTEHSATRLAAEDMRRTVRECIDRLPDEYRTVVLLRDLEGLSTDQAAEFLATTPGNIKTRLHRARQALRTLLEQFFTSEERTA